MSQCAVYVIAGKLVDRTVSSITLLPCPEPQEGYFVLMLVVETQDKMELFTLTLSSPMHCQNWFPTQQYALGLAACLFVGENVRRVATQGSKQPLAASSAANPHP